MTPNIGLNLVFMVPEKTGGMEIYARELLARLPAIDPAVRFTAFVNREAAERGVDWGERVRVVTVPVRATNRLEWVRGEQQLLPRLARREGCDLIHSLASTGPLWGRFRRVVTIHDLSYRMVPDAHMGVLGLGMRILVPAAAHRSHRVIVDSHSTRTDLLRFHRLDRACIDVVPLGVRLPDGAPRAGEDQLRARHRLGRRPLLLCVSAKRPHKNLLRLIESLMLIPRMRRPVLVIAGYPTPHERELRARVQSLDAGDDVRLLDWVDEVELEGLYAMAAAFVFPSLYEGFGLPVLEAMARRVPVATSDRGSLPEVAGSAALTFDPEDPQDMAGAVERLLVDGELADRLRTAGRERALTFTWEATARLTSQAYERALGGGGVASARAPSPGRAPSR